MTVLDEMRIFDPSFEGSFRRWPSESLRVSRMHVHSEGSSIGAGAAKS